MTEHNSNEPDRFHLPGRKREAEQAPPSDPAQRLMDLILRELDAMYFENGRAAKRRDVTRASD
jgi:hypothetical protein